MMAGIKDTLKVVLSYTTSPRKLGAIDRFK